MNLLKILKFMNLNNLEMFLKFICKKIIKEDKLKILIFIASMSTPLSMPDSPKILL